MSMRRRQFTAEFKARVALAATREDRTPKEQCLGWGAAWKRELEDSAVAVFAGKRELLRVGQAQNHPLFHVVRT